MALSYDIGVTNECSCLELESLGFANREVFNCFNLN